MVLNKLFRLQIGSYLMSLRKRYISGALYSQIFQGGEILKSVVHDVFCWRFLRHENPMEGKERTIVKFSTHQFSTQKVVVLC